MSKFINVITPALPFSSDPMKYDFFIHHVAFTSTYSTLVSTFQGREIKGVLAKRWHHDPDFKVWEFEIRDDLKFSNGDSITVNDVRMSLKRIAFLKSKQKSRSGLCEFLEGIDSFNDYSKDIAGISVNGNKLVLRFSKSMKDVLEKISFGIYAIVHPSAFDKSTLEWIDNKKVISSGAYEVTTWTEKDYTLKLRDNFNPFKKDNRIAEIRFKSIDEVNNSNDLKDTDLVIADTTTLMVNSDFKYISSDIGTKIGYVYCYGWNKKNHPLSNIEIRKWLRERMYQSLENQGFKYTTSFFPEIMEGVKRIDRDKELVKPTYAPFSIITHNFYTSKLLENKNKKSVAETFEEAFNLMASDSNVSLSKQKIEDGADFNHFDLIIKGTGIDVLDPIEDIRFMFLSKQGIKLPDATGEIKEELKSEVPNIQKINQLLWDQAIIWPLRHYSTGLWVKNNTQWQSIFNLFHGDKL
jgi:ABC-type transport system substrate-binding protein